MASNSGILRPPAKTCYGLFPGNVPEGQGPCGRTHVEQPGLSQPGSLGPDRRLPTPAATAAAAVREAVLVPAGARQLHAADVRQNKLCQLRRPLGQKRSDFFSPIQL